MIVRINKLIH